jgi:hypothetical protein
MHQQLWQYKVEEKLHLVEHEHKRLNTAGIRGWVGGSQSSSAR